MSDIKIWHTVVKTPDPEGSGEFDYEWTCPGFPHCTGFSECCPTGEDEDPYGDETKTIHGVVHTYVMGYGWTVPYRGCVLAPYCDLDIDDQLFNEPPGRYAVDIYWDTPEEPYIDDVKRIEETKR